MSKKIIKASARQLRQRKLAWALKICMGFRASVHFIPNDIIFKKGMVQYLDEVIRDLKYSLRNIL